MTTVTGSLWTLHCAHLWEAVDRLLRVGDVKARDAEDERLSSPRFGLNNQIAASAGKRQRCLLNGGWADKAR